MTWQAERLVEAIAQEQNQIFDDQNALGDCS